MELDYPGLSGWAQSNLMHPATSERDTTLKNVRDGTLLALRMNQGDHKPSDADSV